MRQFAIDMSMVAVVFPPWRVHPRIHDICLSWRCGKSAVAFRTLIYLHKYNNNPFIFAGRI